MKELFLRNRQFILYCVIGASGVSLDFLVYSILLRTGTLQYQAANAVGYASGTLLSFFLNASFNFRVRNQILLRLFSFCLVASVGWAVSAGMLYLFVNRLGFDKYLSKMATLVVVVVLQYNFNRLVSFRKSAKSKSG
ncbi:MAG TPA: GtrA family protein [Verrucomicrobiae bacterium]|nr:GtrA family protein [Verrucomicrobiae bacterium]